MNLLKKIWDKIKTNAQAPRLTRGQQVIQELARGQGTARQLSDRMGLRLTIVRTNLSTLHGQGLIRLTGERAGKERFWRVNE